MIIIPMLDQIVTDIEKKQQAITKQLSCLPEGRLLKTRNNGSPSILFITGQGSSRHRRSVTRNHNIQINTARRSVMSEELTELEAQKNILKAAIKELRDHEDFNRMRYAADHFGWLSNEELQLCCSTETTDKWETEPYEKSDYKKCDLKNMTSRGLLVRSKSELLIAELLYKYALPFRYEQVYRTDRYTLSADFTIKRSDEKIFIWEHQGKVDLQSYVD